MTSPPNDRTPQQEDRPAPSYPYDGQLGKHGAQPPQPGSQPSPPYGVPPRPYSPAPGGEHPGHRPGCITAYVILLGLGVLVMFCSGFSLLAAGSGTALFEERQCYTMPDGDEFCGTIDELYEEVTGMSVQVLGFIALGYAVLNSAIAIGLWQMRMWGWVLAILSLGLSVVLGLVNLLTGNCLALIILFVAGGIMAWFMQNRWRFVSSRPTY